MCWHGRRGATLVESLVGLALVAVCLTLALPASRQALQRHRVRAATQALRDALQLARMHALHGAGAAWVCPGRQACAAGARWEQGWVVLAEDARGAAGRRLLLVQGAWPGLRIDADDALREGVGFTAGGWPRRAGGALLMGSWHICPLRGGAGRELVLGAGGTLRQRALPVASGCQVSKEPQPMARGTQRWLRVLPTSLAVMSTMRIMRS